MTIFIETTTKDTTTFPAPTDKTINVIGDQETTVTVMAMMPTPEPLSTTIIKNTAPEPSTAAETTMTVLAPLSSDGEETTTITDPGFSMTAKRTAPEQSSKATNIDTNTYEMP